MRDLSQSIRSFKYMYVKLQSYCWLCNSGAAEKLLTVPSMLHGIFVPQGVTRTQERES